MHVQWTGALKMTCPITKVTWPKFSISRQYAERCVVHEMFNTKRQKKVHARRTCTAKIYMPTVKIYLPRTFGQCYVLALLMAALFVIKFGPDWMKTGGVAF